MGSPDMLLPMGEVSPGLGMVLAFLTFSARGTAQPSFFVYGYRWAVIHSA